LADGYWGSGCCVYGDDHLLRCVEASIVKCVTTMLATVKIEVVLAILVVLNLIGMTIAAWRIMRRK
jgi:hypothetical protein